MNTTDNTSDSNSSTQPQPQQAPQKVKREPPRFSLSIDGLKRLPNGGYEWNVRTYDRENLEAPPLFNHYRTGAHGLGLWWDTGRNTPDKWVEVERPGDFRLQTRGKNRAHNVDNRLRYYFRRILAGMDVKQRPLKADQTTATVNKTERAPLPPGPSSNGPVVAAANNNNQNQSKQENEPMGGTFTTGVTDLSSDDSSTSHTKIEVPSKLAAEALATFIDSMVELAGTVTQAQIDNIAAVALSLLSWAKEDDTQMPVEFGGSFAAWLYCAQSIADARREKMLAEATAVVEHIANGNGNGRTAAND